MKDKNPEMGALGLILETMFLGFEEAKKKITEQHWPDIKRTGGIILSITIIVFLVSFLLIKFGMDYESKGLLIAGFFIKATASTALVLFAFPIGLLLGGRIFMNFVRGFFIIQLVVGLIGLTVVSIFGNIGTNIFNVGFICSIILGATSASFSKKPVIVSLTGLAMAVAVLVSVFPNRMSDFGEKLGKWDKESKVPRLVQFNSGDIAKGKFKFFSQTDGKPQIWFIITPEGKYELFDRGGFHDLYQFKLEPINAQIARKLIINEGLISPRNFFSSANSPPASQQSQKNNTPAEQTDNFNNQNIARLPSQSYEQERKTRSEKAHFEYGVIVLDPMNEINPALGKEVSQWFNGNATHIGDFFPKISFAEGRIDEHSRQKIKALCNRIVVINYKVKLERTDNDNVKHYSATVIVKVINANSGNIIQEFSSTFPAKSVRDDGWKIALGFALEAAKNELKKRA